MIKADFERSGGKLIGFCVSGHSGYSDPGSDIVCASVSSAVISMRLRGGDQSLIDGLYQHLRALGEEYPKNITVKISEVL